MASTLYVLSIYIHIRYDTYTYMASTLYVLSIYIHMIHIHTWQAHRTYHACMAFSGHTHMYYIDNTWMYVQLWSRTQGGIQYVIHVCVTAKRHACECMYSLDQGRREVYSMFWGCGRLDATNIWCIKEHIYVCTNDVMSCTGTYTPYVVSTVMDVNNVWVGSGWVDVFIWVYDYTRSWR